MPRLSSIWDTDGKRHNPATLRPKPAAPKVEEQEEATQIDIFD